MQKLFKNNKLFKDFTLNIIAVFLFMMTPQLLIYPYLSRILPIGEYGTILTMMAIVTVSAIAFGEALSNTRVLMNGEYSSKKLVGDYNIIFALVTILNAVIVALAVGLLFDRSFTDIIACVAISMLYLFRTYYMTAFKIAINYKKILITSLFEVLGYLLGFYFAVQSGIWFLPFLFGETFAYIYLLFASNIVKDNFTFTQLFKKSFRKYVFLFPASLLTHAIFQLDKFLIYLSMDSAQVAVFTVSTFLGRIMGLVIIPVAGVLLAYYAKESRMTLKRFYKNMGLALAVNVVFLALIYTVGEPVLQFLYPTLTDGAMEYFYIANLAMIIIIFSNIINPTLLRYGKSSWQMIINGIYVVLYVVAGIIGINANGLMGFCYSILIANCIKVVFMAGLAHYVLNKKAASDEAAME